MTKRILVIEDETTVAEVVDRYLRRDGYDVSVVQNPTESLAGDVAATRAVLDAQDKPVILVGATPVETTFFKKLGQKLVSSVSTPEEAIDLIMKQIEH